MAHDQAHEDTVRRAWRILLAELHEHSGTDQSDLRFWAAEVLDGPEPFDAGSTAVANDSWERLLGLPWSSPYTADLRRIDDRFHVIAGQRRSRAEPPHVHMDLVAVGALNVDHIVHRRPASAEARSQLDLMVASRERERILSTQLEVERVLDRLHLLYSQGERDTVVLTTLGGSAYNLVRTLSDANVALQLGYIGVQGKPVYNGMLSHVARIRDVDTSLVRRDEEVTAGRCVSIIQPGGAGVIERQMGVWPGANSGFARYASARFWEIVDYCSAARILHITSLFDEDSPELLADLAQATSANAMTRVSFDPGSLWSSGHVSTQTNLNIVRIMQASSFLFLSSRELRDLAALHAGWAPDESLSRVPQLRSAATQLLGAFPRLSHLVVKTGANVYIVRRHGAPFEVQGPASDEDQVDDTGAGDLFAAGYLGELLQTGDDGRRAVARGLILARRSIAVPGALDREEVAKAFSQDI